jgi:hypothetical protein
MRKTNFDPLLIILMFFMVSGMAIFANTTIKPIPRQKNLENLLLATIRHTEHWSSQGKVVPQVIVKKSPVLDSSTQTASGTIQLLWKKLLGIATVLEEYDFVLRNDVDGNWIVDVPSLVCTTLSVQDISAPSKMDFLLEVYRILRNKIEVASFIKLAPRVVAVHEVDAFKNPLAVLESIEFYPRINEKGVLEYLFRAKSDLYLDFEYIVPRNNQDSSFELFRRKAQYQVMLEKHGTSPWRIVPSEWIPYPASLAETSITKEPMNADRLILFHTLDREGFDWVWGRQVPYMRAKNFVREDGNSF